MEQYNHSLASLFYQLGLNGTEHEIQNFIQEHAPVSDGTELHRADFWNLSQATFLKQAKDEDADWAEVVDRLDVMLRSANASKAV